MMRVAVLFFLAFLSAAAWAGFDEGLEAYNNEDYAAALNEWKPLADDGDEDAQYSLGIMYENGLGVKQNESEAATWYRKAAEKGHLDALNDLGLLYAKGAGVPKDHEEAVARFRKAAEKGHLGAMVNLGWAFAKGYGVKKNLLEAERLYKAAAERDDETARKRLDTLIAYKLCIKKAGTELFGEVLICTTQSDLRSAVKEEGAEVIREDDDSWYDEYDTTELLEGSTTLTIGYVNAKFANAEYVFDPALDAGKVVTVRDMITSKYGKPAKAAGNPASGPVTYSWKLRDGIKVTVSRGKGDTATRLEFSYPAASLKFKRMMKEQEKQAEEDRRKKQSKAF